MTLTQAQIDAANASSAASAAAANANPLAYGTGNITATTTPTPISATGSVVVPASTTAGNTPASVYAGLGDSADLTAARQAQMDAAKTAANTPVDEASIRATTLANFQAEIDAQNALFADKLNSAKIEGAGRIGSGTAIQARRGELGSDFGAAQTDTINQGNDQVYSSINDEKEAAIQNILSQARTQADKTIADKTAAKKAGLDSYVQYLGDSATRATTNAGTAAALLLTNKQTPDALSSEDLDALTASYGISKDQLLSAFATAKAAKDKADAADAAKANKDAADLELTKAQTTDIGTKADQAAKTFEENKREFGLNYALAQQKAATDAATAAAKNGATADAVQAKTDNAKTALGLIDQLKGQFGIGGAAGRALGPINAILPSILPSTVNFNKTQDQLVSLLSLGGASVFKGSGAVSDNERKLLQQSITKLSSNLSPDDYLAELNRLEAGLQKVAGAPGLDSSEQADIASYFQ